jgi:hypothetical protein
MLSTLSTLKSRLLNPLPQSATSSILPPSNQTAASDPIAIQTTNLIPNLSLNIEITGITGKNSC